MTTQSQTVQLKKVFDSTVHLPDNCDCLIENPANPNEILLFASGVFIYNKTEKTVTQKQVGLASFSSKISSWNVKAFRSNNNKHHIVIVFWSLFKRNRSLLYSIFDCKSYQWVNLRIGPNYIDNGMNENTFNQIIRFRHYLIVTGSNNMYIVDTSDEMKPRCIHTSQMCKSFIGHGCVRLPNMTAKNVDNSSSVNGISVQLLLFGGLSEAFSKTIYQLNIAFKILKKLPLNSGKQYPIISKWDDGSIKNIIDVYTHTNGKNIEIQIEYKRVAFKWKYNGTTDNINTPSIFTRKWSDFSYAWVNPWSDLILSLNINENNDNYDKPWLRLTKNDKSVSDCDEKYDFNDDDNGMVVEQFVAQHYQYLVIFGGRCSMFLRDIVILDVNKLEWHLCKYKLPFSGYHFNFFMDDKELFWYLMANETLDKFDLYTKMRSFLNKIMRIDGDSLKMCYKSKILFKLFKFDESIKAGIGALNCNKTDGHLDEKTQDSLCNMIAAGIISLDEDLCVGFDSDDSMKMNVISNGLDILNKEMKAGNSINHYFKSKILYIVNRQVESMNEAVSALVMDNKDKILNRKEIINICTVIRGSPMTLTQCFTSISTHILGEAVECLYKYEIPIPYSALVAASTTNKNIFEHVTKLYIQQAGTTTDATSPADYNLSLKNSNGRTSIEEAWVQGYYSVLEMLCQYFKLDLHSNDIILSETQFKAVLVIYMIHNEIKNLKMFEEMIDWDKLPQTELLKNLHEIGIKQKNWIYVSISLNYNIDQAIKNEKNSDEIGKKLVPCFDTLADDHIYPTCELLYDNDFHVPYNALVAASASNKNVFEKVTKLYIKQIETRLKNSNLNQETFFNGNLTNRNGHTPVEEAYKRKYYDLFHLLSKYVCTKQKIRFSFKFVLQSVLINDTMFKAALLTFMRCNNINNLTMFKKMIDWDKLKAKGSYSPLLRDLCESGIEKNNWIYVSIALDYNIDQAIQRAKTIPSFLFKCGVKNNDKENIALGRKHRNVSTKVDDWYVGRVLGNGGFGQVKMGIDGRGKRVALKFIDIQTGKNKNKSKNNKQRNQLITFIAGEITNIQKINHENVISLFAFNLNVNNKIMLVFEYALYGELYQLIKHDPTGKNRLNFSMAKYILSQILAGLNACHSVGIIHRDIKPQNILVTRKYLNNGKYKLITKIADFGLSGVTHKLANSKKLVFVGTRGYMSPEIVSPVLVDLENNSIDSITSINNSVISGACDVFSVGVILWQLIYGIDSLPFDEARRNDSKYYYVCDNNEKLFWKCHSNVKNFHNKIIKQDTKSKKLIKQLKQLFWKFFTYNTSKRITIEQVYKHEWYNMVQDMSSQEFVDAIQPYVEKLKSRTIKNTSAGDLSPFAGVTSTWISEAQLVCYDIKLIQIPVTCMYSCWNISDSFCGFGELNAIFCVPKCVNRIHWFLDQQGCSITLSCGL